MRGLKAKLIRKILGYKKDLDMIYQKYLYPVNISIAGGMMNINHVTYICDDKRRLYRVAKKIYRQFGILPKPQKTSS